MKPFLGIDITKNKNNDHLNGQEFITAQVSEQQAQMRDEAIGKMQTQEDKTKLPQPLRVARWICMFATLIFLSSILQNFHNHSGMTLAKAYAAAPAVFWICGISLIGWVGLTIWGRSKVQDVNQSEETKQIITRMDQILSGSYAELGVPATAPSIDMLLFRYVEKNGQIIPRSFGPVSFIACDSKIFTENGNLCLADTNQRYEFPLEAVRGIETVQKKAAIPTWNKNVPANKPPYQQYKLRVDNYGFIHFKSYHILKLELGGETWGIYFPCYELPTIESLTGHHPSV